jgi:hypothetical protein
MCVRAADGGNGLVSFTDWTAASGFAHVFATMAGLVGAAAAFLGLYHVRAWNQVTLPAASCLLRVHVLAAHLARIRVVRRCICICIGLLVCRYRLPYCNRM